MNIQPILDRLPAPLKFLAMISADRYGLLKVRTRSWDPGLAMRLGRAADVKPHDLFTRAAFHEEWMRLEPELASLGITDKAFAVNPGDRRALYYLIRGLNSRAILEIGTHIGGSTVHIAAALRELKSMDPSADVAFVTVDIHDVNDPTSQPWRAAGSTYGPAEMIRRLGCEEFVRFQVEPSLSYFSSCDRRFDMIFLDGSHSARVTYQEIPAALRILNEGGFILLHDYYPGLKRLWPSEVPIPGPYLGIRHLMHHGASADIYILPLGELPWPTRLGGRATSLALLGRP
jgi:predicted O-methyltransferase YrrM